jgi:branched-chain amino acid transport system ATP-binding protein
MAYGRRRAQNAQVHPLARQTEIATAPPGPPSAIGLHDVTVRFGGVVALNGVSMTVGAGEIVGLIGPNGAGKSTLLDVIAGSRRLSAGTVSYFGRSLRHVSPVQLARAGMSRTFQQLSLLPEFTVREHVLLGYMASRHRRVTLRGFWASRGRAQRRAAQDASPLAPEAIITTLGLEAVADGLASDQSLGVARLVDLARALAARPRLLLLDEPVSGLSETEAEAVAAVLRRLRRDHEMAVLAVEHNLEFCRRVAERIVAIDFGDVIADGAPAEVLSAPRVLEAYFGPRGEERTDALEHRVVSGLDHTS